MASSDSLTGPPLRSRPSSYDYFDIDDVLATQDKIPCKLEVQIHNLGFLNPSAEGGHLTIGTKLDMSYWLAKELCSRRRKVVSVELPKVYRDGYREILRADASVVDLHKLGPYFYGIGTKFMHFDDDQNAQIIKTLQEVRHISK
jgi:GINS complex subunit 3